MKKKVSLPYIIAMLIFLFYLMVLADVLFVTRAGLFVNPFEREMSLQELMRGSINIKPFHTIRGYIRVIRREGVRNIRSYAVQNLYGNLILFFPMGFFLPVLFRFLRTFPRTMITSLLIIILVEITQLATRTGAFDIDDLILNLPGCVAGYFLYKICSLVIPPLRRKKPEEASPPEDPYASYYE